MDKLRIGQRLVAAEVISEEQLQQAVAVQSERRESGASFESTMLGMLLVELGLVNQETLLNYLVDDGVKINIADALAHTIGR